MKTTSDELGTDGGYAARPVPHVFLEEVYGIEIGYVTEIIGIRTSQSAW